MKYLFSTSPLALESLWERICLNFKTYERDFLRGLHSYHFLKHLVLNLNCHLKPSEQIASITSIWVDSRPQCYMTRKGNSWTKPSCELADLLIIRWDSKELKTGRALLVQAKMSGKPTSISLNDPSTKKEIRLLEEKPDFFLSSDNKKEPVPFESHASNIYSFKDLNKFCMYLNIKKPTSSVKWGYGSAWSAFWPHNANIFHSSYFDCLLDFSSKSVYTIGQKFNIEAPQNSWDELIKSLLKVTLNQCGKLSGGAKQKSSIIQFYPNLPIKNNNTGIPFLDSQETINPYGGIPILIINPVDND